MKYLREEINGSIKTIGCGLNGGLNASDGPSISFNSTNQIMTCISFLVNLILFILIIVVELVRILRFGSVESN